MVANKIIAWLLGSNKIVPCPADVQAEWMEWDVTAVILRWMVLLDKNDGQLLRDDNELRRISINDMDP